MIKVTVDIGQDNLGLGRCPSQSMSCNSLALQDHKSIVVSPSFQCLDHIKVEKATEVPLGLGRRS